MLSILHTYIVITFRKAPLKDDQEQSIIEGEEHIDEHGNGGFLVCVHDVSPDIPYAILRVPAAATAGTVLKQALSKGRSTADPNKFVLEEHLDWGVRGGGFRRTLADDEELYTVQVIIF